MPTTLASTPNRVDLCEMMPDNAAPSKMLAKVGTVSAVQARSQVRKIEDLTWTFYFLALTAVSVEDRKAKDLVAYAQLIIHPLQRHEGRGWLAYDCLFRQQAAAGSHTAGISLPLLSLSLLSCPTDIPSLLPVSFATVPIMRQLNALCFQPPQCPRLSLLLLVQTAPSQRGPK